MHNFGKWLGFAGIAFFIGIIGLSGCTKSQQRHSSDRTKTSESQEYPELDIQKDEFDYNAEYNGRPLLERYPILNYNYGPKTFHQKNNNTGD